MRPGERQGAAAANHRRGGYERLRCSFCVSYEPQPTHHDSLIKYDSNPQVSTLAGRRMEQRWPQNICSLQQHSAAAHPLERPKTPHDKRVQPRQINLRVTVTFSLSHTHTHTHTLSLFHTHTERLHILSAPRRRASLIVPHFINSVRF